MGIKQFDDATPEIIDGLILYEESDIARDVIQSLLYTRMKKFPTSEIIERINLRRGLPFDHDIHETRVDYMKFLDSLEKLKDLGAIEKDRDNNYSITHDGYEIDRLSHLVRRLVFDFGEEKRKEFENDYKTHFIEALKKAKEELT